MTTAIQFSGRKFKLTPDYSKCKFTLSTVDTQNLKTVNYNVKFWYVGELEYYNLVTSVMYKSAKRIIHTYLDDALLKKDFISIFPVTENLKTTPIYCEFEFTIYPTKKIEYRKIYEQLFTNISKRIHDDLFKGNNLVRGKKTL